MCPLTSDYAETNSCASPLIHGWQISSATRGQVGCKRLVKWNANGWSSRCNYTEVIRNPQDHLEKLLKEIRLDFLSSVGEVERYKQLFDEMPELRSRMQKNYVEARDRSSRLLGHLRAVERTLETFASA